MDAMTKNNNITKTYWTEHTKDVMQGANVWSIQIHKDGSVSLVDVMPRLIPVNHTADSAIVQAARVSYGEGTKSISDDAGLIRYLLRNNHTSPFEMIEFKFHCVMPIFVARQWIRHRTASVNEYSGRYSILEDRFYIPDSVGSQSSLNKQGSDMPVDEDTAKQFYEYLSKAESLYKDYSDLTQQGVARETARIGLPVNLYTRWYWKINLHNLLRFLQLRIDDHAQKEIRDYATAIMDLITPIVPVTIKAFMEYKVESLVLTKAEVNAIRENTELRYTNKREQNEWNAKKQLLGLSQQSPATQV